MTKFKYILPLVALFIISCASTPEESTTPALVESVEQPTIEIAEETVIPEPEITETIEEVEPEPVIIEEVEPEPVIIEEVEEPVVIENVYIPEPLDDNLISQARKEIFKAEEARAKVYFPRKLQDIKSKLAMVQQLKESDPDKARELLLEISSESERLILDSLEALKVACLKILNTKTESLLKLKADKYTPDEFNVTQTQKNETIDAFNQNNFTKSLALYRVTYTSLTNLYNSLAENMGYIDNLIRLINSKRIEGESLKVENWAPNEYRIAVDSYNRSNDLLYKQYDAVAGELSLRETLFYAKKAIAQARINIEVAEMDAEILKLMGELENASDLTVLDNEDNIISPIEWEGKADLIETPIEAKVDKDEQSGLTPVDLEEEVEVTYPELSSRTIELKLGATKVLGIREKRKSLLAEAKDLWSNGIEARNNGDLNKAREYLAKSKIFLDEYKSMAVDYIYTVILNPDRRDCLWRISEKDEYYGDPLLWQNIWERNKKLIQDPDLIYPGWKLIIPPIDEELN